MTRVGRAANVGKLLKQDVFVSHIKDLLPPTEAKEYRNTAEILQDLAAQGRFDNTRNAVVSFAENLDLLAAHAEKSPGWSTGRPRKQRPRHKPSIRTANNSSPLGAVPGID
jgi:hypothetical protein